MKCQGCLFPPLAVRRPASTISRTIGSGIGVSLKWRTARTVRIASNVSMKTTSFLDSLWLLEHHGHLPQIPSPQETQRHGFSYLVAAHNPFYICRFVPDPALSSNHAIKT